MTWVQGSCVLKLLAALGELLAGSLADEGLLVCVASCCCCLHCLGTGCCYIFRSHLTSLQKQM